MPISGTNGDIIIPVKLDTSGVSKGKKTVKNAVKELNDSVERASQKVSNAFAGTGDAKATAQVEKLTATYIKQKVEVESLIESIHRLETGEDTATNKRVKSIQTELAAIDKKEQKYNELAQKLDMMGQGTGASDEAMAVAQEKEYNRMINQVDRLAVELDNSADRAEKLKLELKDAAGQANQEEIGKLQTRLKEAQSKLDETSEKLGETQKNTNKSILSGVEGVAKFSNRIKKLASRVFIFSMFTKAFRALRTAFLDTLKGDEEFQASLMNLKAAMWTAFAPVYSFVVPALKAMVNFLTQCIMSLIKFYSLLSGKSVQSMLANGKALKKQASGYDDLAKKAEEAQDSVAGFDKLDVMQGDTSKDTSAVSDLSKQLQAFDSNALIGEVSKTMTTVMGIVSGALFALGVVLICTGHIPLGIALMIAGAAALGITAVQAMNSNETPNSVKKVIGGIAIATAAAMIAVGLIFIATGAALPLGIALLASGIVMGGIVTAAALNSDSIPYEVKQTMAAVATVVGMSLLALGAILVVFGVFPIGIACIIAGVLSLVSAYKLDKNSLKSTVKQVLGTIGTVAGAAMLALGVVLLVAGQLPLGLGLLIGSKEILSRSIAWAPNKFTNKVREIINKIIDMIQNGINGVLNKLNKLELLTSLGFTFNDIQLPHLATGAVLPGGKPYAAIVNDQPAGQTNIETPLDTMIEAFKTALGGMNVGGGDVILQVDSRELGRVAKDSLNTESGRVGVRLVSV